MKKHHITAPTIPPGGSSARSISLREPLAWYSQAEASRIAGIVRSFQTPAGGWSKNLDMTHHARAPGEQFSEGNVSSLIAPFDHDIPREVHWNTWARSTMMPPRPSCGFWRRSLPRAGPAQMLSMLSHSGAAWTISWLPSTRMALAASLAPAGGYHDGITYNDGAVISVLELLDDWPKAAMNSPSFRGRSECWPARADNGDPMHSRHPGGCGWSPYGLVPTARSPDAPAGVGPKLRSAVPKRRRKRRSHDVPDAAAKS